MNPPLVPYSMSRVWDEDGAWPEVLRKGKGCVCVCALVCVCACSKLRAWWLYSELNLNRIKQGLTAYPPLLVHRLLLKMNEYLGFISQESSDLLQIVNLWQQWAGQTGVQVNKTQVLAFLATQEISWCIPSSSHGNHVTTLGVYADVTNGRHNRVLEFLQAMNGTGVRKGTHWWSTALTATHIFPGFLMSTSATIPPP